MYFKLSTKYVLIHQCNEHVNNKAYKNQIVHFRIVIQQNHAYINII